jgi:hypothetical protein
MTEHNHPEAFPEHLRPYLLPIPETQAVPLFLLLEWHRDEVQMRREYKAMNTRSSLARVGVVEVGPPEC